MVTIKNFEINIQINATKLQALDCHDVFLVVNKS